MNIIIYKNRSCNKLRCTSCDFNCIYFKDCEWSKNVDYLFFRNFVPNKEKLSKELIPKKGIWLKLFFFIIIIMKIFKIWLF